MNKKINLVKQEAANADKLFKQGKLSEAKMIYTACAEGLLSLSPLTADDDNFQSALKVKIE